MTVDLAPARVISEPPTYTAEGRNSFFVDLARAHALGDGEAAARLERHRRESLDVESAYTQRAQFEAAARGVEYRVNPTAMAGTGGEFVAPAWLIPLFGAGAVAGRVLADVIGSYPGGLLPLPAGVSSIHIPRFSAGAQTAVQAGQGGAVQSFDETSYDANSTVATISGFVDVSQQLLDQTPGGGYDAIAGIDLSKNYNRQLDYQLFNGSGQAGQLLGLLNAPNGGTPSTTPTTVNGAGATTFTSLYPLIGQAIAGVGNNRGMPAQHIFMSPRRLAWLATSFDSSNRPIVSPDLAPMRDSGWPIAGGTRVVGSAAFKPTWETGALNTGANPDNIVACRPEEMLLWESTPRLTVSPNPNSGVLGVRIRFHRYVAFVGHRYPAGIGVVQNIPAPVNF